MRPMHPNSLEVHEDNKKKKKYSFSIRMILKTLKEYGPRTMHQIAAIHGIQVNTISGRFKTMVEENLIESSGKNELRRTIWKLKGSH